MKAKKGLVLFLVSILLLSMVFSLGVAADEATETAKQGMSTGMMISLIICGVVVVAVIVLCIVKRKALAESLRAYRREMKNITWFSWKQVWRSTVLVIVLVVATALVVGLLDIAFFEGQYFLTGGKGGVNIFEKLGGN